MLMPELDARILAGEPVEFSDKKRGSWPKIETKPDVMLKPGDRVGSLEVVACPGHTPGHIAFLDTRDRSLIAGDAFHSIRRPAGTQPSRRSRSPWCGWGPVTASQALESAVALRALDPSLLVRRSRQGRALARRPRWTRRSRAAGGSSDGAGRTEHGGRRRGGG